MVDFSTESFANPNALHYLGEDALERVKRTTKQIISDLHLPNHELVYTSGATEANNLALKGVCFRDLTRRHIVTSPFEHGSVVASLNYLATMGYSIDVVKLNKDGQIDLDDLKHLVNEETALVTIGLVNSELGIVQDLKGIKKVLVQHPKVIFHSDMTQAIGKMNCDYGLADLISFSGHKIYGFKGIGALLVKKDLVIQPQIHGGKSLSILRSGTPPTELIHSLGVAIRDAYQSLEANRQHVTMLHDYLLKKLKKLDGVILNSNEKSLPHIVNISYLKGEAKQVQRYLSDNGIYLSTSSACSQGSRISRVVYALTKDEQRARTSLRISLSHLTTTEEIDTLIQYLEAYDESC